MIYVYSFLIIILLIFTIYYKRISKVNRNFDFINIIEEKNIEVLVEDLINEFKDEDIVYYKKGKNIKDVLNIYYKYIEEFYTIIKKNEDIQYKDTNRWILDNMYILEKEYKLLNVELKSNKIKRLPKLNKEYFKDYSRIYKLSIDFVSTTVGNITYENIKSFLYKYEKERSLTMSEIWYFPIMIRVSLLQYIGEICKNLIDEEKEKERSKKIIKKLVLFSKKNNKDYIEILKDIEFNDIFLKYFYEDLKNNNLDNEILNDFIEDKIKLQEINLQNIYLKSSKLEKTYSNLLKNAINSLINIERIKYIDLFEEVSLVNNILNKDQFYKKMDLESREYYRKNIEKIAKENKIKESYIAIKAIELSKRNLEYLYKNHVGYYLIDDGRKELNENLNIKLKGLDKLISLSKGKKLCSYILSILTLTIILEVALLYTIYSKDLNVVNYKYIIGFFVLIFPISDLSITLINKLITLFIKPKFLPRIEIKSITEDYKTAIIVPTIINNVKRAKELVNSLEVYYLANKDKNLYFVLLGDFKDSKNKVLEEDKIISDVTINLIKNLNDKYCKGKENQFFFLCRSRVFNEGENLYIGYERKRGKIMEFNSLIKGELNTTYNIFSSSIEPLKTVKYVITLDADTILTREVAKKLIGTIVHPLNKAYLSLKNKNIVRGYGVIQPRIGINILSRDKTYFSKIFSGFCGIDLYSCAMSDVYQDFFGEGIFTGKGIYDLEVFNCMLKNQIEPNTVLSHDLLEGEYVKCGLATEIELIDDYPSYYNSSCKRKHRWIRGDWQLISWIFKKSPINKVGRWKVLDNLRRSLIAPSIMLLIFLASINILPKNFNTWLITSFILTLVPFIIDLLVTLKDIFNGISIISILKKLWLSFERSILNYIFLPYESYLSLDAIVRTLYRMTISKKNLLQWQTAFDAEKSSPKTLKAYFISMWQGSFTSLVLLFFYSNNFKMNFLFYVVSLAWLLSPMIFYLISTPINIKVESLSRNDKITLKILARETWAYFEDFINEECNYIGVDNYQEDPKNILAFRTSPTNIGMCIISNLTALDLGYITIFNCINRLENTLNSMDTLEKYKGHFFNWYDSSTKEPLNPKYISTVDSGNLAGYLYTTYMGLENYINKSFVETLFIGIEETVYLAIEELDKESEKYAYIMMKDLIVNNSTDLISFKNNLDTFLLAAKKVETNNNLNKFYWNNKLIKQIEDILKDLERLFPFVFHINSFNENSLKKLSCQLFKTSIENLPKILEEFTSKTLAENIKKLLQKTYNEARNLIIKIKNIQSRLYKFAEDMNFSMLYNNENQLLSIGYDLTNNKLTESYYDLLASESRISSFIGISKNELPLNHWYKLGRSLTSFKGYSGLISWTGTMFEYYMPRLIMKSFKETLLDDSYKLAFISQVKYGEKKNIPFGISESAYFYFDLDYNYQYKAFGVPNLSLKRQNEQDLVIAPYATIMALMENKKISMKNIYRLIKIGAKGRYGFYEAIDYSKKRIAENKEKEIVKTYMIHHLGMSIMAIDNVLNNNILQKYFHENSFVKSSEILLQEKASKRIIYNQQDKIFFNDEKNKDDFQVVPKREVEVWRSCYPTIGVFSNGNYSLMITEKGSSYSKVNDILLYRYRNKFLKNDFGIFFYIKDIKNNKFFSSTFEPIRKEVDKYKSKFYLHKAEFLREDDEINTKTSVTIHSKENLELRVLEITNNSNEEKSIQVTSYCEVTLQSYEGDVSHPAFGNLFVETEFLKDLQILLAKRKPRSINDKPYYMAQIMITDGEEIGDLEFETSRENFIGRGKNKQHPNMIVNGSILSETVGPVLDPILSLRKTIKLKKGESAKIYLYTAFSTDKEQLLKILNENKNIKLVPNILLGTFEKLNFEMKSLNLSGNQVNLYQDLLSKLLFFNENLKNRKSFLEKLEKEQSYLWSFGISGDLPIVSLEVYKDNQIQMVKQILQFQNYARNKGVKFDLLIIDLEEDYYNKNLKKSLSDLISLSPYNSFQNKSGGIFILENIDCNFFKGISMLYLDEKSYNNYLHQLNNRTIFKARKYSYKKNLLKKTIKIKENLLYENNWLKLEEHIKNNLEMFNGYGGFSNEGKSYTIVLKNSENTPAPWINVISNKKFGFIISELGAGYTWFKNSRENKLTPWNNDYIVDTSGENICISEKDKTWNLTRGDIDNKYSYIVEHGFGYSNFLHYENDITSELTYFVPLNENVKLVKIKLKNHSKEKRELTLSYYSELILGVSKENTYKTLFVKINKDKKYIYGKNLYNSKFKDTIAYLTVNDGEVSFLKDDKNQINYSYAENDYLSVHSKVMLSKDEEKELVVIFGAEESFDNIDCILNKYRNIDNVNLALEEVKSYWQNLFKKVQVKTEDRSFDILMNGWLMYQSISCRLWARTAFYQCGGAFGFRDQLQDVMPMVYFDKQLVKDQILYAAEHQFEEGDVLHWWHPYVESGVRTRFSDDLLWLPYVVNDYINRTGDYSILDENISYIKGEVLKDGEDERYNEIVKSDLKESIYNHCVKAIEKSLKFGEHGLPLMGSGDWNDGMNTVGNKGKGESVWLGWFLYSILKDFSNICKFKNDNVFKKYEKICEKLKSDLNEKAWDRQWYRRAYFDDGTPLGSNINEECKIDSISQSWSVISDGGEDIKVHTAMKSLYENLVKEKEGLILLLTPPFNKSDLNPGYIKSYVPGVRENGGQYTHGAVWAILAFAKLGNIDRAIKLFHMINPINHSYDLQSAKNYKTEPYVITADLYYSDYYVGRGGWSFYTGSSSWMYKTALEGVLGFTMDQGEGFIIRIGNSMPWKNYCIKFINNDAIYYIDFIKEDKIKVYVDEKELDVEEDCKEIYIKYFKKGEHHIKIFFK